MGIPTKKNGITSGADDLRALRPIVFSPSYSLVGSPTSAPSVRM